MRTPTGFHVDPHIVRGASEGHPTMARLKAAAKKRYGASDAAANAFAEGLLSRAIERFGNRYVAEMTEHIERMFTRREQAARVIDGVLGPEALTPDQASQRLAGLFKDIKEDIAAIESPSEFAKKSEIERPDTSDFKLAKNERTKRGAVVPKGVGRHRERIGALRESLQGLKPGRRRAARKAAIHAPLEFWRAVSSETEMGLNRNVEALKAKGKAAGMSDAELAKLEAAVREMSLDRARAQRGPGTAEAVLRAEGLKKLDPALRKLVQGDRQLELLAAENPEALADFAKSSGAKTRSGLRAYIRRRMVTHVQGLVGEFTAAFQLGDRLVLLKGPDYDVTIPGTDLVGVTRDGKVWLIDNKALNASELESVTSLTRNVAKNIADDSTAFAAGPRMAGVPTIKDAVTRLGKATKEIQNLTKGLTPDEIGKPAMQKRINAICEKHGIERVVTNAGGKLEGLSKGLEKAGILFEDLSKPTSDNPPTPWLLGDRK